MKFTVFIIIIFALSNFSLVAQEASPSPTAAKALPPDLPVTSTVMRTNSMSVLDDKKRLGSNDYVSFRVVEDRDEESQHLRVNDNGERSEEHTSELQSLRHLVCRLLLEKKKYS